MKKTILFVGGMGSKRSIYLEDFLLGIESSQDKYKIIKKSTEGAIIYNIKDRRTDNDYFELEIKEVVWQDILNGEKNHTSYLKGTLLLTYWLSPRFVLRCLASSNYAAILNILIGGFALLTWYTSLTIIALKGFEEVYGLYILDSLDCFFSDIPIISKVINSPYWLTFVLVISAIMKNSSSEMVDIMAKVKKYLSGGRIKCLFREKFLISLEEIPKENELIVVAHSFGTILSLDYIVNIGILKDRGFKLITLGSPINFLSLKSMRVKKDREKFKEILRARENVKWRFVYSKTDWMCPDLPEENMSKTIDNILGDRFSALDIGGEENILERILGKPHMKYFYDKKVIEDIVLGNENESYLKSKNGEGTD